MNYFFLCWGHGFTNLPQIIGKSIPHIIASQLAHTMVTAWAGFQIKDTATFKADFSRLVTHGACAVNLLPRYWEERSRIEIPLLALNVGAMLISAFLTWRLVEVCLTVTAHYPVLTCSIAIRMANFPPPRCFSNDKPRVQACADTVHQYSAISVIYGHLYRSVD